MKKKPRFFCDNCGCEVDKDTKACPKCGRFFASVRCPACGFAGAEKLFSRGCPSCGYSAPPGDNRQTPENKSARSYKKAEPPPSWVFFVSILALIAAVAILSFFITR